jgi:DNA-binding response OmpR family regulator
MLTGKDTQDDRERGAFSGATSYLVKPFKAAMIIEEINKQLALTNTLAPISFDETASLVSCAGKIPSTGGTFGRVASFFC